MMTKDEARKILKQAGKPRLTLEYNEDSPTLAEWQAAQPTIPALRDAYRQAETAYKAIKTSPDKVARKAAYKILALASRAYRLANHPHSANRCVIGEAESIGGGFGMLFIIGKGDTWEQAVESAKAEIQREKEYRAKKAKALGRK